MKFLLIILTVLLFSCTEKQVTVEQKIIDRIEFVYNLKHTIDKHYWNTFNDKQFDLPLIYYTDTSSYIVNPTDKFLQTFQADLVFQNRRLKIYKTKNRVDDLPFHMETEMTLGDPTDDYDYHSPFMKCSSYEEVFKTIPQVLSTEEWATMVIHEYFHGFQYKHKSYVNYYEKNIAQIQEDSLKSIYKNNLWFKEYIDQENQFLLQAIAEKDNVKITQLINKFFELRTQRRKLVSEKLNLNIEPYEKCYETMEGTARYIEFALYNDFSHRRHAYNLQKSDTSFKSFKKFQHYHITQDTWLYRTDKTTYFYAIGFNMARLLDKLKVEYKSRLFNEGQLSMEDLLNNELKQRKETAF
ncbi:MAG TPA: hypothetical protein PLP27_06205 [Crocinitomicaceae bacterium]|nr:hypothetical protein [Crocinitomicaceae bacterium]